MFKIASTKDNIVSANYLYLKLTGAKVTKKTVEDTLKNHPNYPSLLAIGDTCNEWNIENVSLKLKAEQLTEVPIPFLTYLTSNSGSFAIVKSVDKTNVEWTLPEKETKNERFYDFFKEMINSIKDNGKKN